MSQTSPVVLLLFVAALLGAGAHELADGHDPHACATCLFAAQPAETAPRPCAFTSAVRLTFQAPDVANPDAAPLDLPSAPRGPPAF